MRKRSKSAKARVEKAHATPEANLSAIQVRESKSSTANQNAEPMASPPTGSTKRELGVGTLVTTIAPASIIVVGFAYVAAYAEAQGELTAWNLELKLGDFTQADLVRGAIRVATTWLPILFLAGSVAHIALGLFVRAFLARKFFSKPVIGTPWLEQTTIGNVISGLGVAITFIVISSGLFTELSDSAESKAKQQDAFLIVKKGDDEYAIVYTGGGLAWAYRYDRRGKHLCSEIQVFKIDETFHAVREHLGTLKAPLPKTDVYRQLTPHALAAPPRSRPTRCS